MIASNLLGTYVVTKLYRRSFLEHNRMRFPEKLLFEDIYWMGLLNCYAEKIGIVEERLYHYFMNPSSVSRVRNCSQNRDIIKVNRTFYYTDEDIELTKEDLTVTLNNQPVTEYSIVPYPNNPKKGKAKFLLVGEGAYGGQKTVTITIKSQSMKWWK